ncbi:hypothetical protein [Acidovorax sp. FHTAMBA]|uniref:hypothetical protein n=1 Tax=Acidovorax sp. FHTAMBA TaxID=3140252 RepID=UPI003182EC6D
MLMQLLIQQPQMLGPIIQRTTIWVDGAVSAFAIQAQTTAALGVGLVAAIRPHPTA